MNGFDLLVQLNDLDEAIVDECVQHKKRKPSRFWIRWGTLAACLCAVCGALTLQRFTTGSDNSGGQPNGLWNWGKEDTTISLPHRADFISGIDPAEVEALGGNPEAMRVYNVRPNEWFLNEELEDFSQVLTDQVVYIVPGNEAGENSENGTCSTYVRNEDGTFHWSGMFTPAAEYYTLPHGFSGLTYERIEADLAGIDYEDYIIARSGRIGTVFVWARCAGEDYILTYPTRPDLLGIQIGEVYTLEELCFLLSGKGDSEGYKGTNAIMASVANFPPERTIDEVAAADCHSVSQEEAYAVEILGDYLPILLPDGYDFKFSNAHLYVTEMKDGTIYRMLRVVYSLDDIELLIMVWDFEVDAKWIALENLTEKYIEQAGGGTFHVFMGNSVWVSATQGDMTPAETLEMFRNLGPEFATE